MICSWEMAILILFGRFRKASMTNKVELNAFLLLFIRLFNAKVIKGQTCAIPAIPRCRYPLERSPQSRQPTIPSSRWAIPAPWWCWYPVIPPTNPSKATTPLSPPPTHPAKRTQQIHDAEPLSPHRPSASLVPTRPSNPITTPPKFKAGIPITRQEHVPKHHHNAAAHATVQISPRLCP